MRCVTNRALNCVYEGNLQPMRVSAAREQRCACPVSVVNSLTKIHANAAASAPRPYTNKHAKRTLRALFFSFLGRDDKLLATS